MKTKLFYQKIDAMHGSGSIKTLDATAFNLLTRLDGHFPVKCFYLVIVKGDRYIRTKLTDTGKIPVIEEDRWSDGFEELFISSRK